MRLPRLSCFTAIALCLAAPQTSFAEEASNALDPAVIAASICGPTTGTGLRMPFRPLMNPVLAMARLGRSTDEQAEGDIPLYNTLGPRSYAVTTSDARAQSYFDQGLKWVYGFNHLGAIESFREAQRIDPNCAMCYWGEALAFGPNINAAMDDWAVPPAFAAITKAQALASNASAKEQALIGALAKRYGPKFQADRSPLDQAYADAMREVVQQYPDDLDAAVLFAESLMDLRPWDYWESDFITAKPIAGEAIATIESVLKRDADHPAAIHLYIHLVEASRDPVRAEAYADRLVGLMPGSGHLEHMPSHIYYRIGRYVDSMEANRRAIAADETYLADVNAEGIYPYGYYPHNVHFLMVSAQMAGDTETALDTAAKLEGLVPRDFGRSAAWANAIRTSATLTRAHLSAPEDLLALSDPGDRSPYVKTMWHYARGTALAKLGRPRDAQAEAEAIAVIADSGALDYLVPGGVPAPEVAQIARLVVLGRISQHAGVYDDAEEAFRAAVAIQDTLPYTEPPHWYYPVRQSLGAVLLEQGRADEAMAVFQESLLRTPNNAWALHGLSQAQRAQGDAAGAAVTEALFAKAWAGKDMDIELSSL